MTAFKRTEELPVGSAVHCACPRVLVADRVTEHIRWLDGRIYFPPPALQASLRVWHRDGCRRALEAQMLEHSS